MPICNRDLDASQQKAEIHAPVGSMATGVTRQLAVIPYPCTLQSVRYFAVGVSNAMQVAVNNYRFVVGAGATVIPMGISNIVLQNTSLSGVVGFSGLAAAGSTLLQFNAGDVVQIVSSVSNGNATDLVIDLVLKKTQDIVSHNGVST